jgi:hypothetical protein
MRPQDREPDADDRHPCGDDEHGDPPSRRVFIRQDGMHGGASTLRL